MSGPQTFSKLSEQVLEEHRLIHFHLDQIAKAIQDLDPSSVDEERFLTLAARIDSLRDRVEEHFKEEENGGLYQGIVDAMPQVESDVMRLMAQHERMLESLDAARTLARRRRPDDAATLRSELESVLRMMRDHEDEEETLIGQAIRKEPGA